MSRPTRDTISAAYGRWFEILPALGLPTAILNGKHQPCPICGGTDRFRFTDRHNEGDFFCSMCGAGKGAQLLMKFHGWDFKRAFDEIDKIIGNLPPPGQKGPEFYQTTEANAGACRRLYGRSEVVKDGDPVALYLAKRDLKMGTYPKALRYVAEMRHGADHQYYPGMLAVFSDASGKPATIHRTFLTTSGDKADIHPQRMFMPGKLSDGGAIRLGPAGPIMGVAEGIETALAASALTGMTVWATTSATMLEKWVPPQETESVVIFSDHDENFVGQAAAFTLAKTLKHNFMLDIEVRIPPCVSDDWNDVLSMRSVRHDAA